MCEIFISADPASYESRTRSVRLHGVVTSIRLEHLYWEVLEEIARRDGMSVTHLIEKLYDELVAARGRIPADTGVPIRSLDAKAVLRELPRGWTAPPEAVASGADAPPARALQRALTRLPH